MTPHKITYHSITYGEVSVIEVCDRLLEFYNKYKDISENIEIAIGSDSQNTKSTKIVTVIVIYAEGSGGISFNFSESIERIDSVREKLEVETGRSLLTATALIDIFENDDKYAEMYIDCPISIHIDAGNSPRGKTKDFINFVIGWVTATGFDCKVKPDSYAASSIADKISK